MNKNPAKKKPAGKKPAKKITQEQKNKVENYAENRFIKTV